MRHILKILIVNIFSLFCHVSNATENLDWNLIPLNGQTMTLIDKKSIEIYRFSNDFALVTWGRKGGAITSPALYWRLEGDMLIIAEKQKTPAIIAFSLQAIKGNVLTVKTKAGKLKKFKISEM